jgi:phage/plasmid-associated DNA primase
LIKDSVEFIPLFKLVVCTNTLFDIVSNDDGTWRRLRKVDFQSKFTDKPFEDPRFPCEDYPHQFAIDTKIDEKFKKWAPILLSMLVDIAYKTQGKVKDVKIVTSATDSYRQDQDIYLEYINENFVKTENGKGIGLLEIQSHFREWVKKTHSTVAVDKKELQKYLNKKYGKPSGNSSKWTTFYFKSLYDEEEMQENENDFGGK